MRGSRWPSRSSRCSGVRDRTAQVISEPAAHRATQLTSERFASASAIAPTLPGRHRRRTIHLLCPSAPGLTTPATRITPSARNRL